MLKEQFIDITKQIKGYFINAGMDSVDYDEKVNNLSILFPEENDSKINVTLETNLGEKITVEEELQNSIAFNLIKVLYVDDKLVATKPIIIFPKLNIGEDKEFIFVHEFIHYLSYFYTENEKFILFGAGIDLCKIDKSTEEMRDNENLILLNESITNMLTFDICKKYNFPLHTETVKKCKLNKMSAYLHLLLKSKNLTYSSLLQNVLLNNKKEILSMFLENKKDEKNFYKNLKLISKDFTDDALTSKLKDLEKVDKKASKYIQG